MSTGSKGAMIDIGSMNSPTFGRHGGAPIQRIGLGDICVPSESIKVKSLYYPSNTARRREHKTALVIVRGTGRPWVTSVISVGAGNWIAQNFSNLISGHPNPDFIELTLPVIL
jgi:hypothetical protein